MSESTIWRLLRSAENHLSYLPTTRPNEPVREAWLKRMTLQLFTIWTMKSRAPFALLAFVTCLLTAGYASATDLVDFTIVGRAQFSVPADWNVITSKSTSEKTIFAFQIPNPADKSSADSSNLSITATDLKSAQDRDVFREQAPGTNPNAQKKDLAEGWGCSTFSAVQQSNRTEYVIWDCSRLISNSGVSVRIAWPHLAKNPPDYDRRMEAALVSFLKSVIPFTGIPRSGVLRHPEN